MAGGRYNPMDFAPHEERALWEQQMRELEQAKADVLKSGRGTAGFNKSGAAALGAAAVYEQLELNKKVQAQADADAKKRLEQVEKERQARKKAKQEQEEDDRRASEKAVANFKMVMGAIAGSGVGLGATILGLTSSASPVAIDTFRESVTLLSASVGSIFVPIVIEAAKWLQDMAEWVRHLDKDTVAMIATGAKWVVIIGGITSAIIALGIALKFAFASPAVLVLGAVSVAVLALAEHFGLLSNAMHSLFQQSHRFAEISQRVRAGGVVTRGDMNAFSAEERRRLDASRNDPAAYARTANQIAFERQSNSNVKEDNIQRFMERMRTNMGGSSWPFRLHEINNYRREQLENVGIPKSSWQMSMAMSWNPMTRGAITEEQIQAWAQEAREAAKMNKEAAIVAKQLAKQGPPKDDSKMAYSREMAPQFFALEEARKRIQVASLGIDPIQQEILRVQRENNMLVAMRQIATNTTPPIPVLGGARP